jgi:hypothetical protein
MEHDLVCAHSDLETPRSSFERQLEAWIREWLNLPAVVADQVMVVLAARVCRLEPGDPVAELDPLRETQIDELIERAVDTGYTYAATLRADSVEDLLSGATAMLRAQVLDYRPASPAVAEPFGLEVVERAGAPGRTALRHSANDTDSH